MKQYHTIWLALITTYYLLLAACNGEKQFEQKAERPSIFHKVIPKSSYTRFEVNPEKVADSNCVEIKIHKDMQHGEFYWLSYRYMGQSAWTELPEDCCFEFHDKWSVFRINPLITTDEAEALTLARRFTESPYNMRLYITNEWEKHARHEIQPTPVDSDTIVSCPKPIQ